MKKSTRESERIRMVCQLWLERYPEDQRTGNHVFAFHGWLLQNRSYLLNGKHGDSYQRLKSDLDGLWRDLKDRVATVPKIVPTSNPDHLRLIALSTG
jgi:hypothetical protein